MKKLVTFAAAMLATALAAAAPLPITQPGVTEGWFSWDGGLGDTVDFRVGGPGGPYPHESLGVSGPSALIFKVTDCCVIGDEFAPVVDGVQEAWTATWTTPGGHFGAIDLQFYGPGDHTLDLIVTKDCCGSGAGEWKTISSDLLPGATEVPLPAAAWMFLTALGGLGAIRSRRLRN